MPTPRGPDLDPEAEMGVALVLALMVIGLAALAVVFLA